MSVPRRGSWARIDVLGKVIVGAAAAGSCLLHSKASRDYFKLNSHSCPASEVFLVQTLTELFGMLTDWFFF